MRARLVRLLSLLCVGCQLATVDPGGKAEQLWQDGQAAMEAGKPDDAIVLYQQSLAEDPQRSQNHLSLAASYVEKGDDQKACDHLERFLAASPAHKNARFFYAELLLRQKRLVEAHTHFEQAVADGQDDAAPDLTHLIHCHTRLVEIADGLEDEYHAHLHRGIGMFLLAQARVKLDDPDGELSVEGLLCKAAAELSQARAERPDQARPCWYLYGAWRQLGQRQLAQRWLRAADRAAPFTHLTAAEHARLQLALGSSELRVR
jgi:tetratricopeptide (TPR) repeat protein